MTLNSSPVLYNLSDGKIITDPTPSTDYPRNLKVLANGDILVSGAFDLIKYKSDGSLDNSFGINGIVGSRSFSEGVRGIELQADGKILLAGIIDNQFALVRYNSDGSKDSSFAVNGIAKAASDLIFSDAMNMKIQSDGKILVSGSARASSGYSYDSAVVRFNVDGSLDSSFGNNGFIVEDFGGNRELAKKILIYPDESFVVASTDIYTYGSIVLRKFDSNGHVDTSYGTNGTFKSSMILFTDAELLPSNDILVIGSGSNVAPTSFGFNWINSQGVNSDFPNELGFASSTPDNYTYSFADAVGLKVLPNGDFLVFGYIYDDFMVLRYKPDATLDTSFGVNGVSRTNFLGGYDVVRDLHVLDDGKIIVVGGVRYAAFTDYQVGLIKLTADGVLDLGFLSSNTTPAPIFKEGAPVLLSPSLAVFDKDLSATNYGGASLEIHRYGGSNADDQFVVIPGTNLTSLDQGQSLVVAGIDIGTIAINQLGKLRLEFNSSATQSLINYAIQSIGYDNFAQVLPEYVQIDFIFNDGNAGAQGEGGQSAVTKSIKVITSTINDPPYLKDTKAVLNSGIEDQDYYVTKQLLLKGFDDPEDDSLSITQVSADKATVGLSNDGLTYKITPNHNYSGDVVLSYLISDGKGGSIQATQTFTVDGLNDAPELESNISLKAIVNKPYILTSEKLLNGIADADGDQLAVSDLVTNDGNLINNGDGTYTIVFSQDFIGEVDLSYKVTDGFGGSLQINKNITVGQNLAPQHVGDKTQFSKALQNNPYLVTKEQLLQGYSDPEGSELRVANLKASNGKVVDNKDGTYTINPNAGFKGVMNLSYQIADEDSKSVSVTNSFELVAGSRLGVEVKNTFSNIEIYEYGLPQVGLPARIERTIAYSTINAVNSLKDILGGFYINSSSSTFVGGTTFEGTTFFVTGSGFGQASSNISFIRYFGESLIDFNTNLTYYLGNNTISGAVYHYKQLGDEYVNQSFLMNIANPYNAKISKTIINSGFDPSLGIAGKYSLESAGTSYKLKGYFDAFNFKSDGDQLLLKGLQVDFSDFREYQSIQEFMQAILVSDDRITGGGESQLLNAYSGNDIIKGLAGDDTLNGGAGNDTLDGGAGADSMVGGEGNDVFNIDSAQDVVVEENSAGNDSVRITYASKNGTYQLTENVENAIILSSVAFNLTGNSLDNQLTGNKASNVLSGAGGNDTLEGGAGVDVLIGGEGSDTYLVDQAAELLSLVELADQGSDDSLIVLFKNTSKAPLTLDLLSDEHLSAIEHITLKGTGLFNLIGNAAGNTLIGNASANQISGGVGEDKLSGGSGNDVLSGGSGNDIFLFDSKLAKNNVDTVTDFVVGEDKLQLDNAIFKKLQAGDLSAENFATGTTAPTKGMFDANDYLYFNTSTGDLYYDADASGKVAAIKFATLTGVNELSITDFVIA